MLLRFRVSNHRSIRDEAELSLVSAKPAPANSGSNWAEFVLPAVGIYGANASGKSTVLDALDFMTGAIRWSSTRWAEMDRIPRQPFALDPKRSTEPSEFEVDFVVAGERYNYGFDVTDDEVVREWLYSYPEGRRRVLLERAGQQFKFRRGLQRSGNAIAAVTRKDFLFLSAAGSHKDSVFSPIHHWLAYHVHLARFSESDQRARVRMARKALEDPRDGPALRALVGVADLGIEGLALEEEEFSDEVKRIIESLFTAMKAELEGNGPDPDDYFKEERWQLRFLHSAKSDAVRLPIDAESSGTLAWISLVLPALRAIRIGEVLLVDEIDSSLHPRLTAAFIQMFIDAWPASEAQLVFTSHDTSLLGPLSDVDLPRDAVWFTEKNPEGATELYALAEFSPREAQNVERRYLQGRYGAVPVVRRASRALDQSSEEGKDAARTR